MDEPVTGMCRRRSAAAFRFLRILLLLSLGFPVPSNAVEFSGLAGATVPARGKGSSYGWQIDSRYNLPGFIALSVSWINEGHLPGHRRDGPAVRIWLRTPPLRNRLSLALGGGTYWYFDTQPGPDGNHANVHGWAPVYGFSATYRTETPWFYRFSADHIHPGGQIDTNVFLLGLGYRLFEKTAREPGGLESSPPPASPGTSGNEVIPFLGITVHNSPGNRQGVAGGVEFRHGISEHLDVTLSGIGENNGEEIRRRGIGSQLWLVDDFLSGRFVLGIGAGLYAFHDSKPPEEEHGHTDLAGLVTFTVGYRFARSWIGRFHWIRVMTDSDRDSDIFVLGAGYRWNP